VASPLGGPIGDAVEPACHSLTLVNGSRLAREHGEHGLERIFGILFATQQAPADFPHDAAVTLPQLAEGTLIPWLMKRASSCWSLSSGIAPPAGIMGFKAAAIMTALLLRIRL
jgi:hypothetical protein